MSGFSSVQLTKNVFILLWYDFKIKLHGQSSQGCRAVLPSDRTVPQRHASSNWPVRQNQRCVGDPAGVAATHQTSRQRPVWRGLDGCVSFRHPLLAQMKNWTAVRNVAKHIVCVGSFKTNTQLTLSTGRNVRNVAGFVVTLYDLCSIWLNQNVLI